MADNDELLKQLMEQTAPDPEVSAMSETVEIHAKTIGAYWRALVREEIPEMLAVNIVMTYSGNFWHSVLHMGRD